MLPCSVVGAGGEGSGGWSEVLVAVPVKLIAERSVEILLVGEIPSSVLSEYESFLETKVGRGIKISL